MTDADPSLLIPDRQVVIPPDNVKKYADLTSDRVIKSWSFLDQVRKQHGDKPQLAFIHETHQFFPYFIMRIKYKGEIPSHLIITAEQAAATASATKPTINLAPVAPPPPPRRPLHERLRQIVHKRSLPPPTDDDTIDLPDPPPPSLESIYTVRPPTLYHPQELDIIKLTALYVARNGREFLGQITSYANRDRREMFDFLKTTHPFFPTFQKLVDAYTNVITPPPATLSSLSSDVKDIEAILSNLKLHATYKRREEVRRANSELNEEEERVAMQLIDWHNFIVVQTLTFDPQEDPYLPEPQNTVDEIINALKFSEHAQQEALREAEKAREEELKKQATEAEMDGMGDEEGGKPSSSSTTTTAAPSGSKAGEDGISGGQLLPRHVKKAGTGVIVEDEPIAVKSGADALSSGTGVKAKPKIDVVNQRCPICGEMMPISQLTEHMKIELLNSNWKEQKQQAEERRREAKNSEIAANIDLNIAKMHQKREMEKGAGLAQPQNTWADIVASMADSTNNAAVAAAESASASGGTGAASNSNTDSNNTTTSKGPTFIRPSGATTSSLKPPPPPLSSSIPSTSTAITTPGLVPPPPPPSSTSRPSLIPPSSQTPSTTPSSTPIPPPPPTMGGADIGIGKIRPSPDSGFGDHEESAKRVKVDDSMNETSEATTSAGGLVPEEEWLSKHPGSGVIKVKVPEAGEKKVGAEFGFDGRTFEVAIDSLKETVATLKSLISPHLNNMPVNKMKMNVSGGAFLNKDTFTLAHYNVPLGGTVEIGLRVRGGKK